MPLSSEPKPTLESPPADTPGRRATAGAWVLMLVVVFFAALALVRSLGLG